MRPCDDPPRPPRRLGDLVALAPAHRPVGAGLRAAGADRADAPGRRPRGDRLAVRHHAGAAAHVPVADGGQRRAHRRTTPLRRSPASSSNGATVSTTPPDPHVTARPWDGTWELAVVVARTPARRSIASSCARPPPRCTSPSSARALDPARQPRPRRLPTASRRASTSSASSSAAPPPTSSPTTSPPCSTRCWAHDASRLIAAIDDELDAGPRRARRHRDADVPLHALDRGRPPPPARLPPARPAAPEDWPADARAATASSTRRSSATSPRPAGRRRAGRAEPTRRGCWQTGRDARVAGRRRRSHRSARGRR